jgi:RimJ/RimL family protein N-acetyltransferase
MAITLRDALAEDELFLREVYACTRAQELAAVPWNEEQREAFLRMQFDAQHSHYHGQFPDASYQVILHEAQPIGRFYVHRTEEDIRVLDLTILPPHRGGGIGTELIQELLAEGNQTDKPVSIWVEHFNPSRTLFERLGFSRVQEDGYNLLLEWRPAKVTGQGLLEVASQ